MPPRLRSASPHANHPACKRVVCVVVLLVPTTSAPAAEGGPDGGAARPATSTRHRAICPPIWKESIFRSIIGGLFAEGLVPPGSVVDAGANSGEEACYYAERSGRTVHAVEPIASNVAHIEKKYGAHLHNLKAMQGGLGSQNRLVFHSAAAAGDDNQQAARHVGIGLQVGSMQDTAESVSESQSGDRGVFRVYRVDDLFDASVGAWRGERLGFAHFDVEGAELDVLNGARATISRDRPLFTTECFVHNYANATVALLQTIEEMNYSSFLVEEQCGIPADCRNLINIPRERLLDFSGSAAIDLASSVRRLKAVSSRTISSFAHAAVCAPGAACCAGGPASAKNYTGSWWKTPCCNPKCVQNWVASLSGSQGAAQAPTWSHHVASELGPEMSPPGHG